MPWRAEDADKHKKGLSAKQKRQWAEIANSVLRKCMADGGSEETCAASAIRQANGVTGNQLHINISNINYVIRETVYKGKKHIIVPITMMVEGVHNGSLGPLYHPASELGRFPEAWNGMPIMIQHPVNTEGINVSANSPEMLSLSVGQTFNAHMDGVKLKAEGYIDPEKLQEISPEAYTAIITGEPLEVSIGVFTDEDETSGIWNNERYTATARNHRPDHLALLPGATGACSWNDGCGVRVNNEKKGENVNMQIDAKGTDMEAKRKELGMSANEFYAIPKDPPSASHLPLFDVDHVRNALVRISQVQGISSEERASAFTKIKAKAKDFDIDVGNNMGVELEKQEHIQNILNANIDQGYKSMVQSAQRMLDRMDNQSASHYLEDMNNTHIVFSKRNRESPDQRMYQQEYELDTNGFPVLLGNPTEVRQKVDYVPLGTHEEKAKFNNNLKGGTSMANKEECGKCMEKVVAIIQSNANPFTAADREYLLEKDEAWLDAVPVENKPATNSEVKITREMILNALSVEDKEALEFGRAQKQARRDNWIRSIQSNTEQGTWSDDDLKACNDAFLEKLYNSVVTENDENSEIINYSALGMRKVGVNANIVNHMLPAGIELEEETKK